MNRVGEVDGSAREHSSGQGGGRHEIAGLGVTVGTEQSLRGVG
jgi:hypothetical protein